MLFLEEINKRLQNFQIDEIQWGKLIPLYKILNLDTDDFCKILDLIGVEKLTEQSDRYKRIFDNNDEKEFIQILNNELF